MRRLLIFSLFFSISVLTAWCQDSAPDSAKTILLLGGVTLEFVLIHPGEFIMGSPETETGRQPDESPEHRVRIDQPFYLGKYEITQQQWIAIMDDNPSIFRHQPDHLNQPVDWVSWNDCRVFIEKLNQRGQGTFRLPTEAEWEYACRAGTTTRFYWGDDPDGWVMNRYAWAYSRAEGLSHPVGQKLPNAWGLYDMSGNVWEWCSDWRGDYLEGFQVNPTGPETGTRKIYRGGSWFNPEGTLRSANRHGHEPDLRFTNAGLRLVLEVE